MAPRASVHEPLSDSDLVRLADLLAGHSNPDALTLEGLDGFFCALVASPINMSPHEYLPVIWGGELPDERAFATLNEANVAMSLMMRHWNSIIADLEDNAVHFLLVHAAEPGQIPMQAWARGFMRGVNLVGVGWRELLEQEKDGELALIPLLAAEGGLPLPREPRTAEQCDQLMVSIAIALTHSYQYFAQARQDAAADRYEDSVIDDELYEAPPRRRPAANVGRNHPCPCGSGRRFKRCCGKPASLHR